MNNLTCWLVTCRPGNSVLVLVVEEPILPAHAAAADEGGSPRRRLGWPTVGLRPPSGQPNRPSARVAHRPSELSRDTPDPSEGGEPDARLEDSGYWQTSGGLWKGQKGRHGLFM